jgi:hypothetical protein
LAVLTLEAEWIRGIERGASGIGVVVRFEVAGQFGELSSRDRG